MRNLNEGKKKASTYMAELAEIDKQSAVVAMEAKINHLQEMADKKKERLSMVSEDENLSELIDKKRVKMMEREIKEIEKAKLKLEKLYEKMTGGKKKEVVDEEEKMDETYGSTTYEEDDVEEGIKDELKKNKGKTWDEAEPAQVTKEKGLAEEYLRMQKLAGVISEEEYKNRLNEVYIVDNDVNGKMPESGDKLKKRITEEHGEDTWQALTKWMDECNKISEKNGWSHWRFSYTKGPSLEKIIFLVEKDKEKSGEANTPNGYFMLPNKKFELPQ